MFNFIHGKTLFCWLKVETGRGVSGNCCVVDSSLSSPWKFVGKLVCVQMGEARQVAMGQGRCGDQRSDSNMAGSTWFQ